MTHGARLRAPARARAVACVLQVDMGSTSPHAADFVKQCVPHAVLDTILGSGHASTVDPCGDASARIVKAVKAMPPLE